MKSFQLKNLFTVGDGVLLSDTDTNDSLTDAVGGASEGKERPNKGSGDDAPEGVSADGDASSSDDDEEGLGGLGSDSDSNGGQGGEDGDDSDDDDEFELDEEGDEDDDSNEDEEEEEDEESELEDKKPNIRKKNETKEPFDEDDEDTSEEVEDEEANADLNVSGEKLISLAAGSEGQGKKHKAEEGQTSSSKKRKIDE